MSYTRESMIKTLETAKEYLKAGFIQGDWICKRNDKTECCAEGSVLLACGINEEGMSPMTAVAARLRGSVKAAKLVGLLDDTVSRRSSRYDTIMDVNDNTGLGTTLSWFDRTIEELKTNNKPTRKGNN